MFSEFCTAEVRVAEESRFSWGNLPKYACVMALDIDWQKQVFKPFVLSLRSTEYESQNRVGILAFLSQIPEIWLQKFLFAYFGFSPQIQSLILA